MTVDELIAQLQALSPEQRALPAHRYNFDRDYDQSNREVESVAEEQPGVINHMYPEELPRRIVLS